MQKLDWMLYYPLQKLVPKSKPTNWHLELQGLIFKCCRNWKDKSNSERIKKALHWFHLQPSHKFDQQSNSPYPHIQRTQSCFTVRDIHVKNCMQLLTGFPDSMEHHSISNFTQRLQSPRNLSKAIIFRPVMLLKGNIFRQNGVKKNSCTTRCSTG